MPFHLVHADLLTLPVDAIVNAANSELWAGGGVCGAIFHAVGPRAGELQAECRKKAPVPAGKAVLTGSYGLKAKCIIHAVGPVWQGGHHHEKKLLASCYRSALELAQKHGCRSIAFPLLSAGIFGYPKAEALAVAQETITGFLAPQETEMDVYLALLDRKAVELGELLDRKLKHYIQTYYQPGAVRQKGRLQQEAGEIYSLESIESQKVTQFQQFQTQPVGSVSNPILQNLLSHAQKTFSQQLLDLIDQKGFTDTEVYKRANMDRKLFSKIRSHVDYHPTKKTALALAVALQLNRSEAERLLQAAGYSLSPSLTEDLVVSFFLENGPRDIYTINDALFQCGCNGL